MTLGACEADPELPRWHKNYLRLVHQHEKVTGESGASEPEFRLPPAIAGAPLVTIGIFWFGWTTLVSTKARAGYKANRAPANRPRRYSSVHWIVPIIGSVIFGAG